MKKMIFFQILAFLIIPSLGYAQEAPLSVSYDSEEEKLESKEQVKIYMTFEEIKQNKKKFYQERISLYKKVEDCISKSKNLEEINSCNKLLELDKDL